MRGNRRPAAFGAAALALCTVLTGCSSIVDGAGTPAGTSPTSAASTPGDPLTTPSISTPPTSTGPATSRPAPSSTGRSTSASATNLADLLAPAPAGSHSWGTAWANIAAPSVAQFVRHVYPASATAAAKSELTHQGIRDIVHRTWVAETNQADELLLRFATPSGARSRYLSVSAAQAAAPGQHRFAVPGAARAVGLYDPKVDSLGNVRAIVYGQVGTIVMELFFYTPATFDKAGATASALAQLRRLPG